MLAVLRTSNLRQFRLQLDKDYSAGDWRYWHLADHLHDACSAVPGQLWTKDFLDRRCHRQVCSRYNPLSFETVLTQWIVSAIGPDVKDDELLSACLRHQQPL